MGKAGWKKSSYFGINLGKNGNNTLNIHEKFEKTQHLDAEEKMIEDVNISLHIVSLRNTPGA